MINTDLRNIIFFRPIIQDSLNNKLQPNLQKEL